MVLIQETQEPNTQVCPPDGSPKNQRPPSDSNIWGNFIPDKNKDPTDQTFIAEQMKKRRYVRKGSLSWDESELLAENIRQDEEVEEYSDKDSKDKKDKDSQTRKKKDHGLFGSDFEDESSESGSINWWFLIKILVILLIIFLLILILIGNMKKK